MKKEILYQVLFRAETDGDFTLKNEDGYFNSSFEYYEKVLNTKNPEAAVREIFEEFQNRFTSKKFPDNFAKTLKVDEGFGESLEVWNLGEFGVNQITYMSGNQDVEMIVSTLVVHVPDSPEEEKELETLKQLKIDVQKIQKEIDVLEFKYLNHELLNN